MLDGLSGPIVTRSVSGEIQQELLRLIMERQLPAGSQLPPERELAETLSVSRTTVRDALRGLADRGLLKSRQGSGWYVELTTQTVIEDMTLHFRLSNLSLQQIREARECLEPEVAGLAAIRRTSDQNLALQAIVKRMGKVKRAQTYLGLVDEFHALLVESTHNPYFDMSLTPLLVLVREARDTPPSGWRWDKSLEGHTAMAAAVDKQSRDEARRLMAEHILRVYSPGGGIGSRSKNDRGARRLPTARR